MIEYPGSQRRRTSRPWAPALVLALFAAAIVPLSFVVARPTEGSGKPAEPRPVTSRGPLLSDEQVTIEMFRRTAPSVVFISTKSLVDRPFGFGGQVVEGTGSGFVWDEAGHIITNFHVISGARSAQVIFDDGSVWNATLVGTEPDKDIAVLQIQAPAGNLRPIPVGTSHDLVVGQRVYAIGNPYGLDQSLSTGVVSALDRSITATSGKDISSVIQTDAAINPGNSGGPLLDSAGRLIGMNTAIRSPSGGSAGIGFAVPVDTINEVVPQIIELGRPPRVTLGVVLADPRSARQFGVDRGAMIAEVQRGSAAEEVGLRGATRIVEGRTYRWRAGDVIISIDGEPVDSFRDLRKVLQRHEPGDAVQLKVFRVDREMTIEVRLGGPPPD